MTEGGKVASKHTLPIEDLDRILDDLEAADVEEPEYATGPSVRHRSHRRKAA